MFKRNKRYKKYIKRKKYITTSRVILILFVAISIFINYRFIDKFSIKPVFPYFINNFFDDGTNNDSVTIKPPASTKIDNKEYTIDEIYYIVRKEIYPDVKFPKVEIIYGNINFGDAIGLYTRTNNKHKIEIDKSLTRLKDIKSCMAHEIIHFYISIKGLDDGDDDHSNDFEKELNRINKLGLDYKVS